MVSFEALHLHSWLIKQLRTVGVLKSTNVQQNCIPQILEGRDCIGCDKTGSGKTLAFALPIIQKLSEDPYGIFALILTPTRELAFQISDQFKILGKPLGLQDCVIVGGIDMVFQGVELAKSPHIVIATPGRLVDHLNSCNTFNLKRIKFLVLDEADRLLEGPFNDQLKAIFKELPTKRQTLLFSATITPTLQTLQEVAMNKPFSWASEENVVTVKELDQQYVLVPHHVKDGYLVHIVNKFLNDHAKSSVMIFTNSCRNCEVLSMMFQEIGLECAALHSINGQKERTAALAKFKSSRIQILMSTDVGSRGLDIPYVDLVVNHNVPKEPKNYIHRVGRTARAGKGGKAITFVTQYDVKFVLAIEKEIGVKLVELKIDDKEILKIITQVAVAKRESEIKLDEMEFGEKRKINKRKQMILEGKLDPNEEEDLREFKKGKRKQKQNYL